MYLAIRFISGILLSIFISGYSYACGVDLTLSPPVDKFFKDSSTIALYFGTAVKVEKPSTTHDTITIRVSETLKGVAEDVLTVKMISSTLSQFIDCEESSLRAGDQVIVIVFDRTTEYPYVKRLDLTNSYAEQLRAAKKQLQSNSTVEWDARKSSARPSP
jgi:hypothetical protein